MTAFSKGKYAQFISDRSGQAFPYTEMVQKSNPLIVILVTTMMNMVIGISFPQYLLTLQILLAPVPMQSMLEM